MIDYEEDYHYAQQRLTNTIVRMADTGYPVYVQNVDIAARRVVVNTLDNNDMKLVKLKQLNLDSPPLGFVNWRGYAPFVMRMPRRRDWKQGLRSSNCHVHTQGLPVNFDMLIGESLANCIIGKYPKIEELLGLYAKGSRYDHKASTAWDRHWALNSNREVLYKDWGVVGRIRGKGNDLIEFNEGCAYLRESFEESVR